MHEKKAKNRGFGPKTAKFGPKYAFWSFWAKFWPSDPLVKTKTNANGLSMWFSDM